jgi:putative tributyrin esterase
MFFTIEFSDPRFEFDNLKHITVKSQNLNGRGDVTVFMPENSENLCDLPLVILLHGVYGSHWAWALKGGIHKTTQKLIIENKISPMILAMPSDGLWGDGSGYLEHKQQNFEKWIVEDVPNAISQLTNLYSKKSKTFIAGLSMGGFGSMRLGAKYPHIFSAFSGLSSVTTYQGLAQFLENQNLSVLNENTLQKESVFEVLLQNKSNLQPFRFDCGVEDILINENRLLHKQLNESQINHNYIEYEGKHEWAYWEKNIVETLLFFEKCLKQI